MAFSHGTLEELYATCSRLQKMSNSSTMCICARHASPTIPTTHSPWIPFTWTSVLPPYVCLVMPKDQFAIFILANNIMLPGLTQSRDLLTSMDLVLKDEPQEIPHATPTNVVYVRVDIHEDLLPDASPNENFIFIDKLCMKSISDDVSISSQYCLIQREETFLHDFRVHPQYIRIDIELSEDNVFDFMTSVTKKYPFTSSAPKVLALPMSWSTQHNSFSISTDRSFQKKVSLSELYELFISSPNMKKAVRAITWRNAFSLIVVIGR